MALVQLVLLLLALVRSAMRDAGKGQLSSARKTSCLAASMTGCCVQEAPSAFFPCFVRWCPAKGYAEQVFQGGDHQNAGESHAAAPNKGHTANATSYSLGCCILRSCSACGSTSAGNAKDERKSGSQRGIEAKTEPMQSSMRMR